MLRGGHASAQTSKLIAFHHIQPASIFHEERNTKILFPKSIWFHLSLRHAWMVINWSWQSQCHYLTFFGHGVKYCDASKKVFHTALISFLLWFSRFKTTPETVTGRNNWLKKWGRKEPQNKFFFLLWKIMFFASSEFINMSWNVANLFSLSIHASHGFMKQSILYYNVEVFWGASVLYWGTFFLLFTYNIQS